MELATEFTHIKGRGLYKNPQVSPCYAHVTHMDEARTHTLMRAPQESHTHTPKKSHCTAKETQTQHTQKQHDDVTPHT